MLALSASGCTRNKPAAPAAADVQLLTIESANPGAYAEDDCDPANEAWAIAIARQAVEARERTEDWPHGAEYSLIRRSAVQWWVVARRVNDYDESGKPRFTGSWDRGIIIGEFGNIMFYVPAK
jgi:hypothetical protein